MFPRFNQLRQPVPASDARDEAQMLFSRYRDLDAMGHEPVKRGKAFNSFLASLLRSGGLEAHADQRGWVRILSGDG